MKRNTIDIITLGCSKNLVDSEKLMRQLEANGYKVTHDSDKPQGEIAVINTCGFIGDAKEESINMILEFCQAKEEGKLKKLYVMGCLSERYLKELALEIPQVDKFYGKFNWNELLADLGKAYKSEFAIERTLTTPHHYAYLKISEGCDRKCSYCAIPIITGRHISRPMEEIIDEVKLLVSEGVKEFQIIAQELTYYGVDLYKSQKLPELIERIANVPGVEWIRLHYAYPAHFPEELFRVMREHDNVCKYMDIALQHISDNMLNKMRRHVSKAETYELIEKFRREVPGIHLRTTLMVGHPGETEEDFEELKEFVKKVRFDRMGAFAYSEEEGTFAAKEYEDSISHEVKQQRLDELMALQQEIAGELSQTKIGKEFKVIIDRKEGDYYIGRTQFDSPEVDPEVLIKDVYKRQAPIYATMACGKVDLLMDAWLPATQADYMKQYGKNLEILGKIYPDARIGLVVPDYVDIHSIEQLNANKEKFGGEIIGIDAGAGIMHATDMAIEKYNLDYKLLESSGPAMTAVLKRAVDEHQWIVVTGWTPHWMFTRFKLKFLEDPKGIFGKAETITAIARKGFGEQHPFVAKLIENIHLSTEEISSLLDDVSQNEYNEKEGAEKWVKEHQELVDSWIPRK